MAPTMVRVKVLRSWVEGGRVLAPPTELELPINYARDLEKLGNVSLLGAELPESNPESGELAAQVLQDGWKKTRVRKTPSEYLKASPDGKHAEMARRLVDAGLTDWKVGE